MRKGRIPAKFPDPCLILFSEFVKPDLNFGIKPSCKCGLHGALKALEPSWIYQFDCPQTILTRSKGSYVLRYARHLKLQSVYQIKVGKKRVLKSPNMFSIKNNVPSPGKREVIFASSLNNKTQNIKN
jgi:hypothetical protein